MGGPGGAKSGDFPQFAKVRQTAIFRKFLSEIQFNAPIVLPLSQQ
jgi:hypothetical protein